MLVEEVEVKPRSFNNSYICSEILQQLHQQRLSPFQSLTLAIGSDGITPDISVYTKSFEKPDFFRDFPMFGELPILAIEVISTGQSIQQLLEKSQLLIENGVKAVWTVEPFTNTVFVTTKDGEKRFHNQIVESEDIKVDFRQIFGTN